MRPLPYAVGLALVLAARTVPVLAQGEVSVGVGAGLAMPVGDFRDETNPGYRLLASVEAGLPELPVGLRIDGAYDRFGFKSTLPGAAGSETGAQTIASASVNLVFGPRTSPPTLLPYAIVGLGMSHIGCAGRDDCGTSNLMGWNAGIGTRFGVRSRTGFAEARLHWVPGSVSDLYYLPVTVGLRF